MSMSAEVTIDRGVALVRPASPEIARALIEAGGAKVVETVTGGRIAFRVPEQVAIKAGLVNEARRDTPKGAKQPSSGDSGARSPKSGTNRSDETSEPHRGASTDAWRTFLDSQGVPYSQDDRRDDLIALWENR